MGQCDEFASYMTQDVAQWLLCSLSLLSLFRHVKQLRTFFFLLSVKPAPTGLIKDQPFSLNLLLQF